MKWIIRFLLLGLVAAEVGVVYWITQPQFRVQTLQLPFSGKNAAAGMFVARDNEDYEITLAFDRQLTGGANTAQAAPFELNGLRLNAAWHIQENGRQLAAGSSVEYSYRPLLLSDKQRIVIGHFAAERGKTYQLAIKVNNNEVEWYRGKSAMEVGLHPSNLVYQKIYVIVSLGLATLFVILLVAFAAKVNASRGNQA